MWLGILLDWALGIPALVAPNGALQLIAQPAVPESDRVWVAFAGLLVVLVSLFYIPGALDPRRYAVSAWLAVCARAAGAIFFLVLYRGYYPLFGLLDASIFIVQAPALLLTMRAAPTSSAVTASLKNSVYTAAPTSERLKTP
jgi:hypothetical protein